MDDLPFDRLKCIVENAVHPVQASSLRKQTMREELLAHVLAVFEEEAKRGDEPTAVERTSQRFGDPTELTASLQGSIPASDTIHSLFEALWPRPGEPACRRFRRYVTFSSLILAVFLPTWYVWVQLSAWFVRMTNWPREEARLLGGPVLILDFFFFALFSGLLLWFLVSVGRKMAIRFQSQQEWENCPIERAGPSLK